MFVRKFLYLLLVIAAFSFAIKAQEAYRFKELINPRWDISEVYPLVEFTNELMKLPEAKGFILVFGKRGESLRYAKSIKPYMQYFKIDSDRLLTGYGGESEERKMELWIVPKNSALPQSISTNYDTAVAFDDYSFGCDPCEFMRRDALELFAKELKYYPKTKAYIIIYPSKSEYSEIKNRRQAQRRTITEKRFLNRLGIKNSRIVVIVGDYDTYEHTELWIVPFDSELPKPALQKSNTSNN